MGREDRPPEHLRCVKIVGKLGRCRSWKMENISLCQKHYLLEHNKNSSSSRVSNPRNPPKESAVSNSDQPRKRRRGGGAGVSGNKPEEDEKEDRDSGNEGANLKKKAGKSRVKNPVDGQSYDDLGVRKPRLKQNSFRVDSRSKHFSADGGDDDCQMCHQCQYSTKRVVRCRMGCRRRYCGPCIKRWYPRLSEEAIQECCPYCRGNCNCKACLRRTDIISSMGFAGGSQGKDDRIRHLKYLVHVLYPFMKQFVHEQAVEKDTEAKIQGLSPSDVEIQVAVCSDDVRVYCNNCRTSIVDFHQSCPNCSYDLCLTCCWDLRKGCLQGGCDEIVVQYINRGKSYLHGDNLADLQMKTILQIHLIVSQNLSGKQGKQVIYLAHQGKWVVVGSSSWT